jgi:hypothetical protein
LNLIVRDATVNNSISGNIDEFRFSLGVARYKENFTPPTRPFEYYINNDSGFIQPLRPALSAPVLYIDTTGNYAASSPVTVLPVAYNPLAADDRGGQVALPDGRFMNYWLCFTTCKRYPVKLVQGRAAWEYIENARGEQFKRLALPTPEIVAAYQIILQADSAATNGYIVREAKRIGRASKIDDFALTGRDDGANQEEWPMYMLRRTMWTEQVHTDATGVWAKLGGDITGYEAAYPLDLYPQLVNTTTDTTVLTPKMTANNLPAPYVASASSESSPSTTAGTKTERTKDGSGIPSRRVIIMPDVVDLAQKQQEMLDRCTFAARKPAAPKATGFCLNCGEPLPEGERWCGPECRDDWERLDEILRGAGYDGGNTRQPRPHDGRAIGPLAARSKIRGKTRGGGFESTPAKPPGYRHEPTRTQI